MENHISKQVKNRYVAVRATMGIFSFQLLYGRDVLLLMFRVLRVFTTIKGNYGLFPLKRNI